VAFVLKTRTVSQIITPFSPPPSPKTAVTNKYLPTHF
jgi:hypothetical protein